MELADGKQAPVKNTSDALAKNLKGDANVALVLEGAKHLRCAVSPSEGVQDADLLQCCFAKTGHASADELDGHNRIVLLVGTLDHLAERPRTQHASSDVPPVWKVETTVDDTALFPDKVALFSQWWGGCLCRMARLDARLTYGEKDGGLGGDHGLHVIGCCRVHL